MMPGFETGSKRAGATSPGETTIDLPALEKDIPHDLEATEESGAAHDLMAGRVTGA